MIKSLYINNFQSHANTDIEFCEGVNTIVGATDSGKSSIIRALCLAIENKPNGNAFIRNGTNEASISVCLDDNSTIKRVKSSTTNSYVLNDTVYNAVGRDVPDDIKDKFSIDSRINIQKQSSPYFLLHAGESERGVLLSEFCNISIALNSAAIARRNALRADNVAKECRTKASALNAKLGGVNAKLLEEQANELVALDSKLNECTAKLQTLLALKNKLDNINDKLQKLSNYNFSSSIVDLNNIVAENTTKLLKYNKLCELQAKLNKAIPEQIVIPDNIDYSLQLNKLNKLKRCKEVLDKPIPNTIEITTLDLDRLEKVQTKLLELKELHNNLCSNSTQLEQLRNELKQYQDELNTWEVCPLCQQTLKH